MQTFRMDGDNNRLYFKNYERRSDEEELQEIMSILKSVNCDIGERYLAPDCDIYKCKFGEMEFTVVSTIDGDGTFLYADDENVLIRLEEFFVE